MIRGGPSLMKPWMRAWLLSLLSTSAACSDSGHPNTLLMPDPIDAGPTCAGSGLLCEGQTSYRCVDGSPTSQTACAGARPFCAPGIGCLVCLPNSTRCDPSGADAPQRCASDGSGWVAATACDAASGQHCVDGRCGDPCAAVDGSRPYLGCDYWATQTPNSQLDPQFPFAVALANPQSFAVTVQVRGGGLTDPMMFSLNPGEVRAVSLPWVVPLVQLSLANPGCAEGELCRGYAPARSAVVRNGAYQVHASAPVAAYQFNPLTFQRRRSDGAQAYSFSNDASLLLSERSLTQKYLVLTAPNWAPDSTHVLGGFIAVTAVSGESTSVTIRLPAQSGVVEADAQRTVRHENLSPGDVALVVGSQPGDLSGAVVEASVPVAVFAGNDCTQMPLGIPACDHLEEQVLPFETLGRDYLVADLRDRMAGSVLRMVAAYDNTVVRFEPNTVAPTTQLRAGQVLQFLARGSVRVSASRPMLVGQFMRGQGTNATSAGDPAMVYEVPVQQFRDRYDVLVPDTYTSNFFGLVVPHGARVLLDGAALQGGSVERLGVWDIVSTPVTPGQHQLRTMEGVPLGVKVYGTARYTSYMYPGGLDLHLLPPD